jgi:hypothetical protein
VKHLALSLAHVLALCLGILGLTLVLFVVLLLFEGVGDLDFKQGARAVGLKICRFALEVPKIHFRQVIACEVFVI